MKVRIYIHTVLTILSSSLWIYSCFRNSVRQINLNSDNEETARLVKPVGVSGPIIVSAGDHGNVGPRYAHPTARWCWVFRNSKMREEKTTETCCITIVYIQCNYDQCRLHCLTCWATSCLLTVSPMHMLHKSSINYSITILHLLGLVQQRHWFQLNSFLQ